MDYNIIADSSCDISDSLVAKTDTKLIPFTLLLGDREYVDDNSLDVNSFVEDMKACTEKIGTAAPSPYLFEEAIKASEKTAFIITISSRLSGSYNSAVAAVKELEAEGRNAYIVDSKSACAGEALVAMKLFELIESGLKLNEIIEKIEDFVKNMKTYFVLDKVDNLLKNGRLSKIKGKLIEILNIKPVLGSDGDGNIVQYSKARGAKQIVLKLMEVIEESKVDTAERSLVIAHCNNFPMAKDLESVARARFNFKDITIVKTRGLSSLYADDKGVVIAY